MVMIIYVGKNNYQNEELTFKFATGNDWWFHAKGAPGSHVIVKAGQGLPPDRTFEEAARLAAWYSSHRGADKVEVDYVEKKQVKKVNGGKPGFVIYHTNYSMVIDSDISGIRQVKEKITQKKEALLHSYYASVLLFPKNSNGILIRNGR